MNKTMLRRYIELQQDESLREILEMLLDRIETLEAIAKAEGRS